ncbi:methionine--tRNA ligase [Candidatus Woesearchaeota archaeon]|nr:methionine--tRNA ligase [Candidatus Woesearchaeota archaeon]
MISFTGKKRIVVTSALPYANGSIHIGHLVEYIQTDIFVRFLKLIGEDAIYCCADDTHGTPISIKAEELGISPEELIEKVSKEHQEDFKSFLIEFDSYYSTNSPENKEYADKIFAALKKKDLIYTKEVENFFDEKQGRFLPDRYVKGECPKCRAKDQYGDVCEKCNATYKPIDLVKPYSTVSGEKPIRKSSLHYFFKLSELAPKLDKWLSSNEKLQPEVVNYVRNWIKEGLQDWDISRDGPYFGFKIPGEENKYYYVWLDAPIGYISSTQNYCKQHGLDAEKDYWKSKDSQIVHFIGKDIIYFHYLFWPAMLSESGFNLPDYLVTHGFLTVNGEKMSKSRGTFFTAKDFLKRYHPEYLRYYYARALSRKMADIDLDFADFRSTVNNELVANIGNFCYRALSFLEKNYDSSFDSIEEESELFGEIIKLTEEIKTDYHDANFKNVIQKISAIGSLGNKYFQDNEPWKLIKEDKEKVQRILGSCVNIVKILGILISPVLPGFFEKLKKQLDLPSLGWKDVNFELTSHKLSKVSILFDKIDEEEEKIFPLNLKVAEVFEVKDHPNADKLMILQVNIGNEKRQVVAGKFKEYSLDDFKGKKIVLVTNLKYAKLRGEESQGMLLAGDDGKTEGLVSTDAVVGSPIGVEGYTTGTAQVSFDSFKKLDLKVKNGKPYYNNTLLKAGDKELVVEKVKDGIIR